MMKLTRNQKMLMFVFGCPKQQLTLDKLERAVKLVTNDRIEQQLIILRMKIRRMQLCETDFAAMYRAVRMELESYFYAPALKYDSDVDEYYRAFFMLEMAKSFFVLGFGSYDAHDCERNLKMVHVCVTDPRLKKTLENLLCEVHQIQSLAPELYVEFMDCHRVTAESQGWIEATVKRCDSDEEGISE